MSTSIFALDVRGRVFQLSTDSAQWKLLVYQGIEFKKISASQSSVWAIGADNQVYIYLYGSDAPIRKQVETYENERWNPIGGFCSSLLPTDRFHFSSKDGTEERRFPSFKLPSLGWTWEDEWRVDCMLDGRRVRDAECWQYAVDFPASYHGDRFLSACVRRRRWHRHMRFVAVNAWAPVEALACDSSQSGDRGRSAADREDVCVTEHDPVVDLAVGGEQIHGAESLSCVVWAVTVSGNVYVREGVNGSQPDGRRWTRVSTPARGVHVCHVACGASGLVWATCWDGSVLVRTGVSRALPTGDVWCTVLPPSGAELKQVSVGVDSVWAVMSDCRVFFRKDVKGLDAGCNKLNATGSDWLELFSEMKVVSVGDKDQVWALGRDHRVYMRCNVTAAELTGKTWRPLVASFCTKQHRHSSHATGCLHGVDINSDSSLQDNTADCQMVDCQKTDLAHASSNVCVDAGALCASHSETGDNVDLIDLAASACSVTEFHHIPWFKNGAVSSSAGSRTNLSSAHEPWRQQLLEQLQLRHVQLLSFQKFDSAVERGVWLKTDKCRWLRPVVGWCDALLELEVMSDTRHAHLATAGLAVYTRGDKQEHIPLAEITCVMDTSPSYCRPLLSLFSMQRPHCPLVVAFEDDSQLNDWRSTVASNCEQLRQSDAVYRSRVWAVAGGGQVFSAVTRLSETELGVVSRLRTLKCERDALIDDTVCESQVQRALSHGFPVNSYLSLTYELTPNSSGFFINLQAGECSELNPTPDIMLHFNPRISKHVLVQNSRLDGRWDDEVRDANCPVLSDSGGQILIVCQPDNFKVVLDGDILLFSHRLSCARVSHVCVCGGVRVCRLLYQPASSAAAMPTELYWRQTPGHVKIIESCAGGSTWAVGNDGTPWILDSGDGCDSSGRVHGACSSADISGANEDKHQMTDICRFFTYENQRWNPLSGFCARGLPTDRFAWSDRSGTVEVTKQSVLLPSRQWHWTSEWAIDYSTDDGVDKDGWQYAIDYPACYHGYRGIQDFVRRRRWVREGRVLCNAPWKQAAHLRLRDISLSLRPLSDNSYNVWAVTDTGQLVFSHRSVDADGGADARCDSHWTTVGCDQPLLSVSCGGAGDGRVAGEERVWVVARDGTARVRCGITSHCSIGTGWALVEAPETGRLVRISAGSSAVWAVDTHNRLYWRREVMPLFPEGSSWCHVADHVRHVSCGVGNATWICTMGGVSGEAGRGDESGGCISCRQGVCSECTRGSQWCASVQGNWTYVSCRGCADA